MARASIDWDLSAFTGRGYDVGRPKIVQALWLGVSGLVLMRWWCPAALRVAILRAFGASVADGVLIRHRVRIHWPWKLTVGAGTWIGEGVWILNLEPVVIGSQVVVSQDALICTGSHDRMSTSFEFDNQPVHIEDQAWIAARSTILRGVRVGRGATVGAATLVVDDVPAGAVVLAPAAAVRSASGE